MADQQPAEQAQAQVPPPEEVEEEEEEEVPPLIPAQEVPGDPGAEPEVHVAPEPVAIPALPADLVGVLDFNGTEAIGELQQASGFIEDWQKLRMPQAMQNAFHAAVDLQQRRVVASNVTANQWRQFYSDNMAALTQQGANLSDQQRMFITALRMQLVAQGYYRGTVGSRHVLIDEVVVNPNAIGVANIPGAFLPINLHVKRSLPAYIGAVAHVFRVRGHHWQDGYQELYDRLARACVLENAPDNSRPPWEHIARTAVHSFGVASLEQYMDVLGEEGRLPGAMVIRRDAAPAGTALIASSAAVISAMRSEPWYEQFDAVAHDLASAVTNATTQIRAQPLAFSRLHQLYGMEVPDYSLIQAQEAAAALAPITQGFINSLPATSPLRNIRAIQNFAMNNPARMQTFTDILQAARDREVREMNLIGFFGRHFAVVPQPVVAQQQAIAPA